MAAGNTPLQFNISVESASGNARPGVYSFRVSLFFNSIERYIGDPVTRKLAVDPRQLEFAVFIFPGKTSIPAGCLWSLRVWLRVNGDEVWVGKDPDFNSIGDASFTRLKSLDIKEQVYQAYVGRALVTFFIKWQRVGDGVYKYSLEYEANGVGGLLFDEFSLKISGDPRTFGARTIMPAGASHRLRVWLRSLVPLSSSNPTASYTLPFNDSYIYHRIWKSDAFKIGARLDFDSLGSKMIMGFPSSGGPQTIVQPL
ncbi:hypothetical protein BDQ17DRAFT_1389501 [Cyathus striatus]|nr:hypothetical protein BDQ17DRAFT_1389501 [Cyathus striatus]